MSVVVVGDFQDQNKTAGEQEAAGTKEYVLQAEDILGTHDWVQ